MKRSLCLLLIIIMLVSVFSFGHTHAFADDPTNGDGNGQGSELGPGGPVVYENPFSDVPAGTWYTEGVLYCYANGYMSGMSSDVFSPSGKTTRAQFVTILAKVAGADLSRYAENLNGLPFNDVKTTWYTRPLKWAYLNGFTTGTSATKFTPGGNVTREQVATFLYTFASKSGFDVSFNADLNYFHKDGTTVSGYAKNAITWAVDAGLISGTATETLTPRGNCTRAQISLMIKKFVEYYSSNCEHEWSEPTCTTGRVCLKCGYSRGTALGHTSYATCGDASRPCNRCGRIEEALGHTSYPTCTNGAVCARCGKEFAALGHKFSLLANCKHDSSACERCGYIEKAYGHSYVTPATCTTASSPCTRCGNVQKAYGHNIQTAATCTTASSPCTRCGAVNKALGHIITTPATCTERSSKCQRCGQYQAALGHAQVTPATCTSASSACTRCGKITNALGHIITTAATCTAASSPCTRCGQAKPALGHKYKTLANCKYDSTACMRCGYIQKALGHDIKTPATCTDASSPCTRCGQVNKALGHNIKTAATCTAASSACTRCGAVNKALGHIITTPATCTVRSSKCQRCGQYQTALGHSYKTSATCTAASSPCTRCNYVQTALGHDPVNGVCSRCKKVLYTNKTEQLRYFLKTNGVKQSNGSYQVMWFTTNFSIVMTLLANGSDMTMDLVYYEDSGSALYYAKLKIPKLTTGYDFDFGYGDGSSGNSTLIGSGYINASTFSSSSGVSFSTYVGGGSYGKSGWERTCATQINQGLKLFARSVSGTEVVGGITIQDLGFKNY